MKSEINKKLWYFSDGKYHARCIPIPYKDSEKMTKYDEFKKWLQKKDYMFHDGNGVIFQTAIFYEFEKEYESKQKEKEIIKIISQYIPEITIEDIHINKNAKECYKELKEKGYLL